MNVLWNKVISQAKSENRTYLMEHECKELLARGGIQTNSTSVAQNVDEAVELSNMIGYPVVLKVLSPEVIHKSDRGGVKLNLKSADEVELAYNGIISSFADKKVIGVTVQKMAPPGLEAIAGVSRGPGLWSGFNVRVGWSLRRGT
ncbi:MAG: acetate--CoA ligase family protein [Dethiobacteria bacterium]